MVYVVDAADHSNLDTSKSELHELLHKPSLAGIPVLVLGNKCDLPGCMPVAELIERMELNLLKDREICCYLVSCKNQTNVDVCFNWLTEHVAKH